MAENITPAPSPTPAPTSKRRNLIVLSLFIIAAVVGAVLWWLDYRKYITTDDANLDSYRIAVAPQVSGVITRLYVDEGDSVAAGDPLFEIESASMISRRQEAEAQYQQLLAETEVNRISFEEAKKNLEIATLAEQLSKTNYERAKVQYEGEAIPLESYQTLEENWKSSKVEVEIARNRVRSAKAAIEASVKSGEAALANVSTMNTDLTYYHVTAPAAGSIAKRWSLPGDMINAGQTVFTMNQGSDIWVSVFLEETKFSNIRMGQDVKFKLDAYSKLTFFGKIYYIGDNAASEFALVPSNNASGNYTKVTQRIPLKISIDRVEGDKAQKQNVKLVSGMSANVKIIKD